MDERSIDLQLDLLCQLWLYTEDVDKGCEVDGIVEINGKLCEHLFRTLNRYYQTSTVYNTRLALNVLRDAVVLTLHEDWDLEMVETLRTAWQDWCASKRSVESAYSFRKTLLESGWEGPSELPEEPRDHG